MVIFENGNIIISAMRDITMPVPDIINGDQADIELRIGGGKIIYYFRLASFAWESADDATVKDNAVLEDLKINRLRKAIEEYDKGWELIQIYPPAKDLKTIQVLYRKKSQG